MLDVVPCVFVCLVGTFDETDMGLLLAEVRIPGCLLLFGDTDGLAMATPEDGLALGRLGVGLAVD